jgi:hypothetical protein
MIDNAINVAIGDIIKNRFVPSTQMNQDGTQDLKGFQRTNTIREELRTLVKSTMLVASSITTFRSTQTILNADITNATSDGTDQGSPCTDFSYYTLFEIELSNGEKLYPIETTQEKLDFMIKDPYQRPTLEAPSRTYFIENATGYKFYIGPLDALTIDHVTIYYLSAPVEMYIGQEIVLSASGGVDTICFQETATVKNSSNANISVKIGDVITYTANNSASTVKVVKGYVSMTTIPDMLFDEIAKVAAGHLLMIVGRSAQLNNQG